MINNDLIQQLKAAIMDGDDEAALQFAKNALKEGMDPLEIVKTGLQPAVDEVGEQFNNGELFLPELMMAGDAAAAAMDVLLEQIEASGNRLSEGKVIIATMFGDNHSIGINLVQALLSAVGFSVVNVGVNVHPKDIIAAAENEKADIIAASTLITLSMPYQRELIGLLTAMGKREDYFVIIGGGPVTPDWALEIGADGYGRDAKDAASLCRKLMEGNLKPPLAQPALVNPLDLVPVI